MRKIILFMICAALLSGCASTVLESKRFQSYEIGQTKTATIGDAFLVDQDGELIKTKQWVGLINSPDGWGITSHYSANFIRKELLYSGRTGNTIEIAYREFRGGFAAPAFSQNLKYDLSESRTIQFQKFSIEVINADNQRITYKVLNDR